MSSTSLASVPDIGDKAPDFELPDVDQKWRKLSEFRDKKTIVAFFPAAESPHCTTEMCAIRDHLNFPVLSDYKRDTIKRYGIIMSKLGTMEGYNAAKRSIFILDEDGKVIYRWISDNPTIEPKYSEIKEVLKKAKK